MCHGRSRRGERQKGRISDPRVRHLLAPLRRPGDKKERLALERQAQRELLASLARPVPQEQSSSLARTGALPAGIRRAQELALVRCALCALVILIPKELRSCEWMATVGPFRATLP